MPFEEGTHAGMLESYLCMSFLVIFTYEPQNRDAVIEQRKGLGEGQIKFPGWKVEGEWADVAGGRFYTIVTPEPLKDPSDMLRDREDKPMEQWNLAQATFMRNNLGKVEMIPIVPTAHLIFDLLR